MFLGRFLVLVCSLFHLGVSMHAVPDSRETSLHGVVPDTMVPIFGQ